MKYNTNYLIYTYNHDLGQFEIMQVKGTPTKIEILTACHYKAPKMFIHKVAGIFRLSEAVTGCRIADFKRLKDLNDYISDDKNIERIFNAINSEKMEKKINDFNKLKKEYLKA